MKLKYILIIGILATYACTRITEVVNEPVPLVEPFNPFDTIDYTIHTDPTITIDSASFLGLHTYIFSKSCNQPACHDGTFEPDFRTVQSAYNSLVNHPVKKNYPINPLPYRVKPGDINASMMYHRITLHSPPNYERMPSSGNPLPDDKIALVRRWIEDGAKDIYGNLPSQTTTQPRSLGVAAFLPNQNDLRIDTARGGQFYYPFYAPTNDEVELWFLFLDSTSNGGISVGQNLTYNKIQISTNPVDFSNAIQLSLVNNAVKIIPSVFSQDNAWQAPYSHRVKFTPSQLGFQTGDRLFFRVYVQDEDHDSPTEIPQTSQWIGWISYYSFVLM